MNTGFKLAGLAAVSLALSGCVNLSGYDAADKFACKAPDGVLCESMTGIYANAKENNLPGQRVTHAGGAGVAKSVVPAAQSGVITKPIYSGTPVRTAPEFCVCGLLRGKTKTETYTIKTMCTCKWIRGAG